MKTIPLEDSVGMIPQWGYAHDRRLHGLRHARAADG